MKKNLALLALVLAATAAAYLPAIDGEFVFDDFSALKNPFVTVPFDRPLSSWLAPGRKVVEFTFALNHLAVGLDTRGWHVTNVAIHLGVVLLAWLFARVTLARAGLARPELPALAAAALFGLHPLQTESVAYVSQRAESLASGFYLAALLLLLRRDEEAVPLRRNLFLAGAVVLHAIGTLGVKLIVITLPAAWLLHAAMLPPPREGEVAAWRGVRARLPAALPLFAVSAFGAFVTLRGMGGATDAGFDIPGVSPLLYPATQLRVVATYLRLLLWPAGQCADWWVAASQSYLQPAVLGSAALLVALTVIAIVAAVRFRGASGDAAAAARTASFGVLFFFLAISPSSSIVPLRDPLAEHRIYLGALGVTLACVAGVALTVRRTAGSRATMAGASITLLILAAAGAATARRSVVWSTELSLWSDAAVKAPRKARVHVNLGAVLQNQNRLDDALASYYLARELPDDHTVPAWKLLNNIVGTLLTLRRTDEARAEVIRVLERSPRDPRALGLLARVEFESGRDAQSVQAALEALAVDPENGTALKCLGMIQLKRGDIVGARRSLLGATATGVLDSTIYSTLGKVEERAGDVAAACGAYARAAALPGNRWVTAEARRSLARLGCR